MLLLLLLLLLLTGLIMNAQREICSPVAPCLIPAVQFRHTWSNRNRINIDNNSGGNAE
jgi:hypothetical protein